MNKAKKANQDIIRVRGKIEQWRRNRTSRAMPEALWAEVGELARGCGVTKVAKAMGLNFRKVKGAAAKRAKRSTKERSPEAGEGESKFVELVMPELVMPKSWNVTGEEGIRLAIIRGDGERMEISGGRGAPWERILSAWLSRPAAGGERR